MALFLVQFQGKRLCPLSGGDLCKLLEIGALRGQDPLYSYRDKQWYYIDECAGFAKYYDETPRSERTILPRFTPPPLDSLKIITLTEVREVIQEVMVEKIVPSTIEKVVEVEVEKIVEHFVEPDPDEYVARAQYQELELKCQEQAQQLEESATLAQDGHELRGQVRELSSKLAELSDHEKAIDEVKAKLSRENKRADSLYFKNLDLKEENLSLEVRLKETQKDEEELWRRTGRLSKEIKTYERENKTLKLALERTSPEAIASNEIKLRKFDELQRRYELLSRESQEKDQLIEELNQRLKVHSDFNEENVRAQIEAEIRREYSRRWQEEKQKQLQQVITQENAIKEKSLEKESSLKVELDELRALNTKLKKELESAQREHQLFARQQESGYQELKDELEGRIHRESEDYKELIKRREGEIEKLSSRALQLQAQLDAVQEVEPSPAPENNTQPPLLERVERELRFAKVELAKYKKKCELLAQKNKELVDNVANIQEEANNSIDLTALESQITLYKTKLGKEQQSHHELKLKFKKQSIQIQKYKLKLQSAAEIIDTLKDKSKVKNNEITKLKGEMQKLAEAPTQLLNMNELGLAPKQISTETQVAEDEQSEEELAKLIGDSFEVPNLTEWKIKTDEGIQGPYSYAEMLELKNQKLINDKTQIKKKAEGTWKSMRDFFELTTNVITHKVMIDGTPVTKYYIKRGSFRAPFYEVCSFDLGGNELRGHCTSLSIGGAFIELARLDSVDALREKKIFVRFSRGTLSATFGVQAVIKNISETRPKGIGVMFVDLPEHGKEAIIEYINNYLEKLGNSAA